MTGSVSRGKDQSKSLRMTGRPLITPNELKSMPKDTFIVTRTGVNHMKTILRLFFLWGIELDEKYDIPEAVVRKVSYADKRFIEKMIERRYVADEDVEDEDDIAERNIVKIAKNLRC